MPNIVVVGTQWGDEGKGKVVDLLAPHVNAYKRLQPDMLNGYWANWAHDDRSVTVRVPPARGGGTRLEQRTADAAANP